MDIIDALYKQQIIITVKNAIIENNLYPKAPNISEVRHQLSKEGINGLRLLDNKTSMLVQFSCDNKVFTYKYSFDTKEFKKLKESIK